MGKRVTVVLDEDIIKKLRNIQAGFRQSSRPQDWRFFSGLPSWREQHGLWSHKGITIAQQCQCQFGAIQQEPWIFLFSIFNQSVQALIRPFFTRIPLGVLKTGLLIRCASCSGPSTIKKLQHIAFQNRQPGPPTIYAVNGDESRQRLSHKCECLAILVNPPSAGSKYQKKGIIMLQLFRQGVR